MENQNNPLKLEKAKDAYICIKSFQKQQRLKNIPYKREAFFFIYFLQQHKQVYLSECNPNREKRQIKLIHSLFLIFRKAKGWFSWTLVPQTVYCAALVPTAADLRFGRHDV